MLSGLLVIKLVDTLMADLKMVKVKILSYKLEVKLVLGMA